MNLCVELYTRADASTAALRPCHGAFNAPQLCGHLSRLPSVCHASRISLKSVALSATCTFCVFLRSSGFTVTIAGSACVTPRSWH